MIEKENLWDKKAKNYDKFGGNLSEFQIKFFKILDEFGVNFRDKSLIDIGCGTGIYTLYLAKICKSVTGVDSSKEMLKEFENSMQKRNITNAKTIFSDFKSLNLDQKFDISFLTMSPALQDECDFIKFMNLGNLRVFMNWEKPRKSTLLAPFFEKFVPKNKEAKITSTARLVEFLQSQKIPFKTQILSENRFSKRDFNEALSNILWHLQINNAPYNEDEIKKMLKLRVKNDFIFDEIEICVRIIVF